jgi:mono/diheme cytochrome c family protein
MPEIPRTSESSRFPEARAPIAWGAMLSMLAIPLLAQTGDQKKLNLSTGKDIYLAACVGCHGPDGKGAPDTTVGFKKPDTFPDFSDCRGTTPELDADWKATIHDGGLARGFSRIMPSFSDALTEDQIDMVVGYLRSLCKDQSWPRGELNFPRAMFTEKAFPESEIVMTTTSNAQGAPGTTGEADYEYEFGVHNQLEVAVPFGFTHDQNRWLGGIGDIGVGVKRVLFSSLHTGSIFSVEGLVDLPTGDKAKGLGNGTTAFETFGAFDQMLPAEAFVQLQAGGVWPTHTQTTADSVYWRGALGKSFRVDHSYGRMWTPIVELIANRNLVTGAKSDYNVVPQFQVTLSRRQHVAADVGVSIPVNDTMGRPVQVVFYVLWDWFDGGLLEGWK